MRSTVEIILTIIGLSFWFLFPIGMILSMERVDRNTDQIIQLEHHKLEREPADDEIEPRPVYRPTPFDWHHPFLYFRHWLTHES